MERILITNATIVNQGTRRQEDVYLADGRIAAIGGDLSGKPFDRLIEAAGKYLLPGLIDDQVHFREPGLTHKGDIRSESMAAVAGGVTSFMEMPNTQPPTLTRALLEEKYAIASRTSYANYAFYLGASNNNLEEIKALDPAAACGVKVFMGASTGNMLVDDPEVLDRIFADSPVLVATHCEDTPTIQAKAAEFRERYGEDPHARFHARIRNEDACYRSSSLAVELAKRNRTRLHLLHLTTARELDLLSDAPLREKSITAEVCVHHLFFDDRDYETKGNLIKCNPSIKTKEDRDALRKAVLDHRIDVIATDHAPHTREEKALPYFKAPSGLPLVQHSLLSLLDLEKRNIFPLELIVEKACHAPARLFDIKERGFIREGYWADLVLVDLHTKTPVSKENLFYRCGWSPFEQHTFPAGIDATLVSGVLAFENGRITGPPSGSRLTHDRC